MKQTLEDSGAWKQPMSAFDDVMRGAFAMVRDIEHTIVNLKDLARGRAVAKYLESRAALIARPKGRNTS
jgi:hypothetical protein